jgi:hypothetical protein
MKNYLLILFVFIAQMMRGQLIHDESYLDAEFNAFKAELTSCVLSKDKNKLMTLLADSIQTSPYDCESEACAKSEFMNAYFNEAAEDSWKQLSAILRYGFKQIKSKELDVPVKHETTVFLAPSFYSSFNDETHLLILGENVNIRKTPSVNAEVVKKVSWELLECDCSISTVTETTYQEGDGKDWIQVKEKGKVLGYVVQDYTSIFIYKQLRVAKVKGKWKVTYFYHFSGC